MLAETPLQRQMRDEITKHVHKLSGLFAAAAMRKVQKDLVAMKVVELKEELGERGEALSGNKAWLRRRLHAAIVSEYFKSAAGAAGE